MSSGENDKKISYFNTLIFTIVTGIISLCIVGLLFFEVGQKMIYFIIAFEIGVFILITYCIYRIASADKKLSKSKDGYVLKFNECPDYFSRYINPNENGRVECINNYIVKDRNGQVYLSTITPAKYENENVTVPGTVPEIPSTTAPPYTRVVLNALEKDENFPKNDDKCGLIFKTPVAKEPKTTPYRAYASVPWTYMRSRCESFV